MQYFGVAQVPATLGLSLFVVGYGYVKPLTRNHAARIDDSGQNSLGPIFLSPLTGRLHLDPCGSVFQLIVDSLPPSQKFPPLVGQCHISSLWRCSASFKYLPSSSPILPASVCFVSCKSTRSPYHRVHLLSFHFYASVLDSAVVLPWRLVGRPSLICMARRQDRMPWVYGV
jgi:hypothetical protein